MMDRALYGKVVSDSGMDNTERMSMIVWTLGGFDEREQTLLAGLSYKQVALRFTTIKTGETSMLS
jgi:hypothetical protein